MWLKLEKRSDCRRANPLNPKEEFVMFRPRFYSCCWPDSEPMGIYQIDDALESNTRRYRGNPKLPESILRLAHAEYERQYSGQDYERMQERGGLSILEVARLLADYVERLGGKPTMPRLTPPKGQS